MSPTERLAWGDALALAKAPACALAVGLRLMQHANSQTGEARPGLREALGVDVAKDGARWLRDHGWITVARLNPGRPTTYLLTMGQTNMTRGNTPPGGKSPRVESDPEGRGNAPPGPGGIRPPEPGKNQGDNQGVAEPPPEVRADEAATGYAFPLKGGGTWPLPSHLLATLTTAHPDKDVPGELRRAAAWLACNRSRAKTARGMPRFVHGWLDRAEGQPTPRVAPRAPGPPDDDLLFRPVHRKATRP